jgi:proteasome lid subunit RPN8/RPN11
LIRLQTDFKKIFVTRNCFINLVTSTLEVSPRETTGLLIGKIAKRKIQKKNFKMVILEAAYPIQTAKRRSGDVFPLKNKSAFLRAFNSVVSIPSFHVVGEYHSHPDVAELSDDDLLYVRDRFDDIYKQGELLLEPSRWLEIVIRRTEKNYSTKVDPGWTYSDYNRKARCVVRTTSRKGFDLTFGAFWIYRLRNSMRKKETDIYIPWTSRYWT